MCERRDLKHLTTGWRAAGQSYAKWKWRARVPHGFCADGAADANVGNFASKQHGVIRDDSAPSTSTAERLAYPGCLISGLGEIGKSWRPPGTGVLPEVHNVGLKRAPVVTTAFDVASRVCPPAMSRAAARSIAISTMVDKFGTWEQDRRSWGTLQLWKVPAARSATACYGVLDALVDASNACLRSWLRGKARKPREGEPLSNMTMSSNRAASLLPESNSLCKPMRVVSLRHSEIRRYSPFVTFASLLLAGPHPSPVRIGFRLRLANRFRSCQVRRAGQRLTPPAPAPSATAPRQRIVSRNCQPAFARGFSPGTSATAAGRDRRVPVEQPCWAACATGRRKVDLASPVMWRQTLDVFQAIDSKRPACHRPVTAQRSMRGGWRGCSAGDGGASPVGHSGAGVTIAPPWSR